MNKLFMAVIMVVSTTALAKANKKSTIESDKNLIGLEIEITKDLEPISYSDIHIEPTDNFIGQSNYEMKDPKEICNEYVIGGKPVHHHAEGLCTVGDYWLADINNTQTDSCHISITQPVRAQSEIIHAGTRYRLYNVRTNWRTAEELSVFANVNETEISFTTPDVFDSLKCSGEDYSHYDYRTSDDRRFALEIRCAGPHHLKPMQILEKLNGKADFKIIKNNN